jgi:uncharacterized protein (DUF488 family)
MVIFTIGHSTRTPEAFLALLQAHGVTAVADVRTVPRSRRHPHFSESALAAHLAAHGIAYRHFAALGGLRKPRRDSPNGGWLVEGFRGYADYMDTAAFAAALEALREFAGKSPVAVMCAESKWWQCHRRLLADALVVRGIAVRHIMSNREAVPHELTPFAHVDGTRIQYPSLLEEKR